VEFAARHQRQCGQLFRGVRLADRCASRAARTGRRECADHRSEGPGSSVSAATTRRMGLHDGHETRSGDAGDADPVGWRRRSRGMDHVSQFLGDLALQQKPAVFDGCVPIERGDRRCGTHAMRHWRIRAAVVLASLALGACFHRHATRPSTPSVQTSAPRESGGRYAQANDSTPAQVPDINKIPEPVPRDEPRSVYGNKSPYKVLGETYRVLPSCKGYDERGLASWYGNKFHGYTTSNFEKYDMYAYSAASKVLPIPCYVRVTNLENGRSAIVRVNDRG